VETLERGLQLYRDAGMRRETIRELERLASCYQELGQPDKAKQYRKEATTMRAQP